VDLSRLITSAAFAAAIAAGARGSLQDDCGLTALADRIGAANVPDGEDVIVGQVESSDGSGNYMPDSNHAEFDGKFLIRKSGGSTGASSHATMVGRRIYGLDSSIAPGIWFINCYEVNNWLQGGFLNVGMGSSTPPESIVGAQKIWNHSWIGSFGSTALDNEGMRRLDWTISRDDTCVFVGINNGSSAQPLLANTFNAIAVGRSDGDHAATTVPAGYDGEGRTRPDIVAPLSTTSECTGILSGAAAVLVQTARDAAIGLDEAGDDSEVIKAVLLASASHDPATGDDEWSNGAPTSGPDRGIASTPLDPVVGAGHLDVNRGHAILTGDRQPGGSAIASPADATETGWALASMAAGETRAWRFRSLDDTEEVSVTATWHRTVASNFASWTAADFDLELHRIEDGVVIDLTGEEVPSIFDSGNVRSDSAVDNIEHLFIEGLAAGQYLLRLTRNDATAGTVDVAVAWYASSPVISGDLDASGLVDVMDLLLLLTDWSCADCAADLNGDGTANEVDLLLLLDRWGS